MHSNRIIWGALLVAGLAMGCTRTVVYKEKPGGPVVVEDEKGPPAHAPAWGYRRNHEGEDTGLVYDPVLEVYIVSGYDECYYSAGQYFRFIGEHWEWSVSIDGTWKVVASMSDLPSGLRHHHPHGKAKGHSKH